MYLKKNNLLFVALLLFVSQLIIAQNDVNTLAKALQYGTPQQVVTLIEKGTTLKNNKGYFETATLNSNIGYVKENYSFLLKKGYKLYNTHHPNGNEYLLAFYKAIEENNTELITFLASQPEWKAYNKDKIFRIACDALEKDYNTEPSALKTLLDSGLDLGLGYDNYRLFHLASDCHIGGEKEQAIAIMKKLKSYNFDFNVTSNSGETILHKAAKFPAPDSIYVFFKSLGINTSLKNEKGKTSEDLFFKHKFIELFRSDNYQKLDSALKQSVSKYNIEYINLLVENAKKPTFSKNLKLIINNGYIPSTIIDNYGDTELDNALSFATKENDLDVMEYIFTLKKSFKQNIELDKFYSEAISSLYQRPKKHESAVQFLIDKGLDIQSQKNKEFLFSLPDRNLPYWRGSLEHFVLLFDVQQNGCTITDYINNKKNLNKLNQFFAVLPFIIGIVFVVFCYKKANNLLSKVILIIIVILLIICIVFSLKVSSTSFVETILGIILSLDGGLF